MTYCLAISVREGLLFASDSRTHTGLDQVSTYSKMHTFGVDGSRQLILLTSGSLATTQSVAAAMSRDIDANAKINLHGVENMDDAADYLGEVSRAVQAKHAEEDGGPYDASFILGGQIHGNPPPHHADLSGGHPHHCHR